MQPVPLKPITTLLVSSKDKLTYAAEYRKTHRSSIREAQKKYYLLNKDKVKSKVNEYRLKNLEKIKVDKHLYYRNTLVDRILYEARKRADKYSIPFDLDREDIHVPEVCPVLGIPIIVNSSSGPNNNSPSLDRVVPSLGYVHGNVKVISWRANRLKSDSSLEEMEALLKYMRKECQN